MKENNPRIKFYQYKGNEFHLSESDVIEEVPLNLTVNGDDWLTFMCTPIYLEELATGFLYNEMIINSITEIESIRLCSSGEIVDVWLNKPVSKPKSWNRTSGCTGGVSSLNSFELKKMLGPPNSNGVFISSEKVTNLVEMLFNSQDLYRRVGGVHTSALCTEDELCVSMEDIGRHNTLDKIAGYCLTNNLKLDKPLLITTGRISSDMLHKSIRLGAAIVISRTSPSTLSIRMAELSGITLIGYARRNSFRVYTHSDRIIKK